MGSVANAEAKANANTSYLNLILKHGIIILKKKLVVVLLVLFIWL